MRVGPESRAGPSSFSGQEHPRRQPLLDIPATFTGGRSRQRAAWRRRQHEADRPGPRPPAHGFGGVMTESVTRSSLALLAQPPIRRNLASSAGRGTVARLLRCRPAAPGVPGPQPWLRLPPSSPPSDRPYRASPTPSRASRSSPSTSTVSCWTRCWTSTCSCRRARGACCSSAVPTSSSTSPTGTG